MKAKLIKTEVNYLLENQEGVIIASTSVKKEGLALSLKNCEAIERGYDLDELVESRYPIENTGAMFMPNRHEVTNIYRQEGFIEGAKAILEILGDKKFSEEDVKNIFAKTLENAPSTESHNRMISDEQYRHSVMDELYDRITKSLQKTEWDVEVEMKWNPKLTRCDECGEGGYYLNEPCDHPNDCKHWSPKLDADGCLILKRV